MEIGTESGVENRKVQLVMKEYDTAFASYSRHSSQIVSLRGWTITLLLAYFGLLQARGTEAITIVVSIPVILILGGFFVLEALERLYAKINIDNILEIQEQFAQGSSEAFGQWIRTYEFRDQRIRRLGRRAKARLLLRSLGGFQSLVWYSFLVALLLGMLVALRA
jgi:hypothetical protein